MHTECKKKFKSYKDLIVVRILYKIFLYKSTMCKLSDQCVSFPVLFCFVNSQGFAIRTLASHINCSLLTFCS